MSKLDKALVVVVSGQERNRWLAEIAEIVGLPVEDVAQTLLECYIDGCLERKAERCRDESVRGK